MPARQPDSPREQRIGAISGFVNSIDSHIILRMIRESKTSSLEPSNFELSELYHRDVQSLSRLAQLNVNT